MTSVINIFLGEAPPWSTHYVGEKKPKINLRVRARNWHEKEKTYEKSYSAK
jgi:hypothetical protein